VQKTFKISLIALDKTENLWYNKDMKNNNNNNIKTKAFVFDFDETLAHTDAVVLDGTDDKFAEFKNPESILNGTPLELMGLAKEVYAEGYNVYVLTARPDCIENAIAEFLARYNIIAKTIFCVGKNSNTNIAKAKQAVLMTIIDNHDITYFYDDDEANIELASSLNCRAELV